jgi:anti-anti-sigma factor
VCDGPIRAEWLFQPSALLGGDALGYGYIDADHFAIYMIDVSGHGAGAAMHSVSVLNILRQRALPANVRDPAKVLTTLNAKFQTEQHDGMYFTMWYGVYNVPHRTLRFAAIVPNGRHALVDLSRVEFIGSLGVRMFISVARSLGRRNAQLVLMSPQAQVREVFEHVSLHDIIPVWADETEAHNALKA